MSKPFNGQVFCCTGLVSDFRRVVEGQIAALGGTVFVDLMSSVQYLVVGDRKTEKYRFSVRYRHDIAFVDPSAIADIHSRWKAGDDKKLDINSHLLPVFANLTVCAARVDSPPADVFDKLFAESFRTPPKDALPHEKPSDVFSLQELVTTLMQLGATVSSSLTPECSVLIGTESAGKRYTKAKEWSIPAVHPLWVYDSCLRGAALELEDYELTSNGYNPYNSASYVWKKLYAARQNPPSALVEQEKRERPSLKKSSRLWSSIMDSSHSSTTKQVQNSTWDDPGSDHDSHPSKRSTDTDLSETPNGSVLFSGFRFLAVGLSFAQQDVLRKVVESHSGLLTTSPSDESTTHVLVLAKSGPQASLMLSALPKTTKRRINSKEVQVVTDWFIERSVFYGKICNDPWGKPLAGLVPSKSRCKVCISGFTGVELLHIEKLIGYLNMEFCDVLNAKRDLLIINVNLFRKSFQKNCPKLLEYTPSEILECPVYTNGDESKSVSTMSSKNKINAAKKWNIPVVSIAYLWEMIESSVGEPTLQMPDIVDHSWCIFAPKEVGKSVLLDAGRNLPKTSVGQADSQADDADSVKLPSPRKHKERQKYGRLIGGSTSLTEKLKRSRDEGEETPPLEEESGVSQELLTQVGYGYEESIRGNSDLIEKLEAANGGSRKRRKAIE